MRLGRVLLASYCALAGAYLPARACSCTNNDWTMAQYLDLAEVAFSGNVTSIVNSTTYPGFLEITFDVTACWKGVASSPITVVTSADPGGCGYESFVESENFLVFAGNGINLTGSCSGTRQLNANGDLPGGLPPAGTPGDCVAVATEHPTWGGIKIRYP